MNSSNFAISVVIALALPSCYAPGPGGREDAGPCPGGTTPSHREIPAGGIPVAVDVLLVIDDSGSMAAEQAMLVEAFPRLVERLLTGADPDTGLSAHAPVRDLHVGVVSTDMGVMGFSVTTCEDDPMSGDDGILQHTPHGDGCDASYPTFLGYNVDPTASPDTAEIEKLSRDFGCIAALGTQGCGFEQHLAAAYKALVDHSVPGGANAGFLRDDSILAVLFVTDEEDCSPADPAFFDFTTYPYSCCMICYYKKDDLHPPSHYAEMLRTLRPDPDDLVVGFIAGVPPGSICEGSGDAIAGCLDEPAMQETVRADNELLEYACKFPVDCSPPDPPNAGNCISEAFPGRRFVEIAQALGPSAVVRSVCTDTFVPFIDDVSRKLGSAVVARTSLDPLPVGKPGDDDCFCETSCTIVEILAGAGDCPDYDRDGVPDFRDADGDGAGDVEDGRSLCEIPQSGSLIGDCSLPCDDPLAEHRKEPSSPGWWYDPSGQLGIDTDGDTVPDMGPVVTFEGVEPQEGSSFALECCS
jgi:hypothetical protein